MLTGFCSVLDTVIFLSLRLAGISEIQDVLAPSRDSHIFVIWGIAKHLGKQNFLVTWFSVNSRLVPGLLKNSSGTRNHHCRTSREGRRNGQMISVKKQILLLAYLECLCHWVHWSQRGPPIPPSFTWAHSGWLSITCHWEVRKGSLIPHEN